MHWPPATCATKVKAAIRRRIPTQYDDILAPAASGKYIDGKRKFTLDWQAVKAGVSSSG
jgi:hypothetical protein